MEKSCKKGKGGFVHSDSRLFKTGKDKEDNLYPKVRSNKCSFKCNKACSDLIESFNKNELECVKNKFKGETVVETKTKLLLHLRSQCDLGLGTSGYVFKGHTYCNSSLSKIANISEYLLKSVLRDSLGGVRQYIHGNDSSTRESIAVVKFTTWMKTFCQLYGQSAPDAFTTVLPSWLTKATLFTIYVKESTAPFVRRSNFYKLFKSKFGHMRVDKSLPHVRISKYSSHSVCSQCVALSSYQKTCKSKLELELCKSLKFKHRENFGLARRKICELQELAATFPEDHLFIALDGMDNRKSDLPKFQQNVKNLGSFHKLPSHITGVLVTSGLYPEKLKNFCYLNHNQFEQGSCMVITILYHVLQAFLHDHKKFPKFLHINTDNCSR